MPGSNVHSIPGVIEALIELNPKSIIDIGAGNGKYSFLCKEYIKELEVIDAIEPDGCRGYYNNVCIGTIQGCDFAQEHYDVALMTALMCKFTKEEGIEILKKVKEHCKHIVITIEKLQHGGQTQWYPYDFQDAEIRELPHEWLIIL